MSGPQPRRSGGTILGGGRRPPAPEPHEPDEPDEPELEPEESLDPDRHDDVAEEKPGQPWQPPRTDLPERSGRANRRRMALVATCAVLAAAAVAMALVAVVQHQTLQRDRDRDNQLRDVSGHTVAALTTYDYQQLDQWKQSVLTNLTGTFAKTFDASIGGYEQVYTAEHNRGTSTVEGVWIGQAKADQASTVVLVRITVTSLTGTHTIEPYVQLTLLKVAGKWRVDDVQYTLDSGNGATPSVSTPAP